MTTLPSVNPKRIGVLGFSMGAYRAWQLAALSDQVAATAAISWFGNYQGLMTPDNNVLRGQSSFYMLHPGIANKLDFPDIASLAAPADVTFNGGKISYSLRKQWSKLTIRFMPFGVHRMLSRG